MLGPRAPGLRERLGKHDLRLLFGVIPVSPAIVFTQSALPSVALVSDRVRLRVVHPEDYPFLYELSLAPELRFRWRFRNEQLGYQDFIRALGSGVFCQYLVQDTRASTRIGLAVCYQANRVNRNAYVAVQGAPAAHGRGLLVEASQMFIDHLFTCYEFDKLYAECLSFNLPAFRSGLDSGFVEEGVLRNHERLFGQSWDLHMFALYRTAWRERHDRLVAAARDGRAADVHNGMTFEQFVQTVAKAMELDTVDIRPATAFVEDLAFDSIQLYELVVVAEELGSSIADGALADIETFGDLHFHYLQGLTPAK